MKKLIIKIIVGEDQVVTNILCFAAQPESGDIHCVATFKETIFDHENDSHS